ncbi:MAG: RapZ C-terminal domain-containing protein [Desulfocapsaceae bacterium]
MDAEESVKKVISETLRVNVFSFGFKHGVPVDANLLFDVRFLPNPYWQEELRPKSGLEREVSGYVIDSVEGKEFLRLLKPLLLSIATQTARNRKELRIGIGCTGGRHRSVAVVEALAQALGQDSLFDVSSTHRDLDKNGD